jgi:hypothetical protein
MTCMLYKNEEERYKLAETTLCALQYLSEKAKKQKPN